MDNQPPTAAPSVLPEQRAAMERLLVSGIVARAPRLREFLAYVLECMLTGRQDEVTEQQIGCRVFGRPEGYNHTEDNIVRVTARNLRAKLDEYYQGEGSAERWIVEIPKGGYLPSFRLREPPETVPEPSLAEPQPIKPRLHRREILAWVLSGALRVGFAATLWFRPAPPKASSAGLISFLFPNPSERVTVVMVDSGLQLYRSVAGRTVSLDDYAGGRYLQSGFRLGDAPLPEELAGFVRTTRNTTFSSAFIAAQFLRSMPAGQVEIRHPTQLNSRDFQRDHMILLGGPWSNPWAQPFEAKLNFQILTGAQAKDSMVKNRTPGPGEQELYFTSREGSLETSYARIALLPNPGGSGKVLLLGATTSGAMEAASDFLLRREHLDALRRLLHLTTADPIPWFEIVLEVKSVDVTPHGVRIIASRIPSINGR